MIAAQVKYWERHFSGPVWKKAFDFIQTLDSDSPEGITEILGKDMYARVMSYETVDHSQTKVEAHHEYIDIQASLVHGERIEWFPLEDLEPSTEYNPEKDAQNFKYPGKSSISVSVYPGMFAVFFPEDAHMPKLIIDQPRMIKKIVVKVRLSLLDQ